MCNLRRGFCHLCDLYHIIWGEGWGREGKGGGESEMGREGSGREGGRGGKEGGVGREGGRGREGGGVGGGRGGRGREGRGYLMKCTFIQLSVDEVTSYLLKIFQSLLSLHYDRTSVI